jgi:hypothetical protein
LCDDDDEDDDDDSSGYYDQSMIFEVFRVADVIIWENGVLVLVASR